MHVFVCRNGLPVYREMKFLSEVRRFGMAVMFLSAKDKEGEFVDTFSYEVQPR